MAIVKPVILEDGQLKTAGVGDQVPQSYVQDLDTALEAKVDKVAGKQLSDENYTNHEKVKLEGIQAGAQVNAVTSVAEKTGAVTLTKEDVGLPNVDDTSDINKPISNPAQAALDSKVDKVTGKGLSETNFTQAEKTKLADIASEATKNRTDDENADKVHTHMTAQVDGLDAALEGKVDKQVGKGLSDTNFTQDEKDKLSSLESSKFVGLFVSESALPLSGSDGDYANVDGGVGSDVYRVIWDSSDNKWVRVQGVPTELTPAQIKQQYESNPDTNAFTDGEKTKLADIATEATKNRADIENADRLHTHTVDQVTGLVEALDNKVDTTDIAQTTGQSTTRWMSQAAITEAINAAASSSSPSSSVYTYDSGRVIKITDDSVLDTVIEYNESGTVNSITYPDGRIETYTYDSGGNVTSMTATGG